MPDMRDQLFAIDEAAVPEDIATALGITPVAPVEIGDRVMLLFNYIDFNIMTNRGYRAATVQPSHFEGIQHVVLDRFSLATIRNTLGIAPVPTTMPVPQVSATNALTQTQAANNLANVNFGELEARVAAQVIPAPLRGDLVPPAPVAQAAVISNTATPSELAAAYSVILSTPLQHVAEVQSPQLPADGPKETETAPKLIAKFINWGNSAYEESKPNYQRLCVELAEMLGMNVSMMPVSGRVSNPGVGPFFTVHIASSPTAAVESRDYFNPPAKMWGHDAQTTSQARFKQAEIGFPIYSPEGDEIGAVNQYNLWIYHNLFQQMFNGTEQAIFSEICKVAVTTLKEGKATYPPVEKYRNKYMDICQARVQAQLRQYENTVNTVEEEIKNYRKALTEAIRNKDINARVYNSLITAKAGDTAKYGVEFDALTQMPMLERVQFRGDSFIVYTKLLFFTDPRTNLKHELGKMKIDINQSNSTIRFTNLTNQIKGYSDKIMQAPHVFTEGRACWGNIESTVTQLIATYEFSALIELLIAFLESVNVEDPAGEKCNRWPLAKTPEEYAAVEEKQKQAALAALEAAQKATRAAPASTVETEEVDNATGMTITYFSADGRECDAHGNVLV